MKSMEQKRFINTHTFLNKNHKIPFWETFIEQNVFLFYSLYLFHFVFA